MKPKAKKQLTKIDLAIRAAAEVAAPVFAAQFWTWADTAPHPPSRADIEKTLHELCATLRPKSRHSRNGTGRLTVEQDEDGVKFFLDLGTVYS